MYKHIQSACVSHPGLVRKNNEDNFYYNGEFLLSDNNGTQGIITDRFSQECESEKGILYAVFDGMGGGEYGEIASFMCAEETERFFSDDSNIIKNDIPGTLNELCISLNDIVSGKRRELNVYQMGTTIVAAYISAGRVWICNIGDSRCYLYNKEADELCLLSVDHVEKARVVNKPRLTQHIGIFPEEMTIEPSIICVEPKYDDRLLLCSDGLTDMIAEDEIRDVIKEDPPSEAAGLLLEKALKAGGKDNITSIVVRFA